MQTENTLAKDLRNGLGWTVFLAALYFMFNMNAATLTDLISSLPFLVIFYFFFFSIGRTEVSERLSEWIGKDLKKVLFFPAFLLILYFIYVIINHENPFQGTLALVPYLVLFPVLAFAARQGKDQKIDWLDIAVFAIFLLPTTLIEVNPTGNLPWHGNGFDSLYRITIILTAVYAFVTVRGLTDVGFFPVFRWKYLFTSLWVWISFYLFVLSVGIAVNFIKVAGHTEVNQALIARIALAFTGTFLHTAIFEELFFRGILQNMLAKRIFQSKSWVNFWIWGIVILLPIALIAGYTLKGGMQWFPGLITLILFGAAFGLERTFRNNTGDYTSIAIAGTLFGLVHYHSGSIIYIGFACIAGWAYGYTWLKTKNIFYAALVHALVGTSALIFGLELMK